MGLWARLLRRRTAATADAVSLPPELPTPPAGGKVVALPEEPMVFECRECGKVFDARRRHPRCPECESADVTAMSDDGE